MIAKRNYKDESDLDAIYRFLSDTYIKNGKVDNWDSARWFFNRYCIHSKEELSGVREWTKSIQIWESNANIVGVSHSEEPNDYFIQLDNDYASLLNEIFVATIERARKLLPKGSCVNISSLESDKARLALFESYNGSRNDFLDDNRKLLLDYVDEQIIIPKNCRIENIDVSNTDTCAKVAQLYTKIWPTSPYISSGKTVKNFSNALAFKKDLSFVVINENDEYTAFTILWSSANCKHAHLYPFGINRKLAGNDVAEALLLTCAGKLKSLGYESLTLGAWYSDEEETLFEKIGFENTEACVSYRFQL